MVRDVNIVRVHEEECASDLTRFRFDARVFVSFFFLLSNSLSRLKFFLSSSRSFSLSLSFCCYLRMMIISLFFDVAFGGTSSSSFRGLGKEKKNIRVHLRWKEKKEMKRRRERRRRSHSCNLSEQEKRTFNSLRNHHHFLSLSLNLFLKTTNRLSSPPRWWRNRAKPWSLASLSRWLEYA